MQKRQARYYNSNAQDLPALSEGDTVRMKPFTLGQKEWKKGVIVERLNERSYEVETADGFSYRQNRVHLKRTNELPPELNLREPPKPSSDPDKTDDPTRREKSSNTEEAPCIEPCKETTEQDLGGATRTIICEGLCYLNT